MTSFDTHTGLRRRRVAWTVVTVLSNAVGLYALFLVLTNFASVPGTVAENGVLAPWGLHVHIAAASLTLLAGPWQFNAALRGRVPRVHRTMGLLYLVGVLVGGTAGAVIALGSSAGPAAGIAFLTLGATWVVVTVVAYLKVRAHDYESHRRWMLRSFALAFAAVTLRVYLEIGLAAGMEYTVVYPVVAWLSFIPNVIVIETWIRRRTVVDAPARPRAAVEASVTSA